jgi:hypothetical protein
MSSTSSQLRIRLTPQLEAFLHQRSRQFGVSKSDYVRHLLLQDWKGASPIGTAAASELEDDFHEEDVV